METEESVGSATLDVQESFKDVIEKSFEEEIIPQEFQGAATHSFPDLSHACEDGQSAGGARRWRSETSDEKQSNFGKSVRRATTCMVSGKANRVRNSLKGIVVPLVPKKENQDEDLERDLRRLFQDMRQQKSRIAREYRESLEELEETAIGHVERFTEERVLGRVRKLSAASGKGSLVVGSKKQQPSTSRPSRLKMPLSARTSTDHIPASARSYTDGSREHAEHIANARRRLVAKQSVPDLRKERQRGLLEPKPVIGGGLTKAVNTRVMASQGRLTSLVTSARGTARSSLKNAKTSSQKVSEMVSDRLGLPTISSTLKQQTADILPSTQSPGLAASPGSAHPSRASGRDSAQKVSALASPVDSKGEFLVLKYVLI